MNAAARRPALSSFNSFVNLYLDVSRKHPQFHYSDLHICCPSRKRAETGSKEHTNVPDIDREVKCVEYVVDDSAGSHETRVYGSSNYTAATS